MPKIKGKQRRRKIGGSADSPESPENENVDTCSDITQLSNDDDNGSIYAESVSEDVTIDLTEEKIKESLENATHKNVSIRVEALKILQSTLASNFVPGLLLNWKITAADAVERCMKKKSGEECKRAVNLGVLFAVQLGDEFNHLVTKFGSILKDWVCDWTLNADFRSECVNALSLYTFLTTDDLELISSALNTYRDIWTRIKPNGPVEYSQLSCSCLNAWALMLLCLPDRYVENAIENDLPILCDYIENGHPDVRITSGETLCLLYELANQLTAYEELHFKPVSHEKTLAVLEQWSHESAKFHAKRDRRVQRATFRDIYAAIKSQDVPEIRVKFGTENLTLDSWAMKLCYSTLCTFLRGGINAHLQQNYVVRDKLSLGAPILEPVTHKATKLERQIFNQSVNRARNLARGKQRDKKPAFHVDD